MKRLRALAPMRRWRAICFDARELAPGGSGVGGIAAKGVA
jgi:hypothetical protein